MARKSTTPRNLHPTDAAQAAQAEALRARLRAREQEAGAQSIGRTGASALEGTPAAEAPTRTEAAQAAEAAAVQAAPARPAPNLDALFAAEEALAAKAADKAANRKPRKPAADRRPTLIDEAEAMLKAAGREVKVAALVHALLSTRPDAGRGAKGAVEARATAEAARARGDEEAASEAEKRASEAARAQAEATVAAALYTEANKVDGRLAKGERGMIKARQAAEAA